MKKWDKITISIHLFLKKKKNHMFFSKPLFITLLVFLMVLGVGLLITLSSESSVYINLNVQLLSQFS